MTLTIPTVLTLLRMALIPVLVLAFYAPLSWGHIAALSVFVLAGLTDWLDGWVARRFAMSTRFGAFLDPVADKLMVAVALILIVQRDPTIVLALAAAIIIGREITISALREWMAEIGQSTVVRVAWVGKFKTVMQMVAIGFLLYREPLWGLPILTIGTTLLVAAAVLTLYSMLSYLQAAWPAMREKS